MENKPVLPGHHRISLYLLRRIQSISASHVKLKVEKSAEFRKRKYECFGKVQAEQITRFEESKQADAR